MREVALSEVPSRRAATSLVGGGTAHGSDSVDRVGFTFSITLYGGRLATVKAPVPMTKRNLERLKRMIEDQLEPFLSGEEDPEAS